MPKLHFGVLDVPYQGYHGRNAPSTTTGDVAQILEEKYHIFAAFWKLSGKPVADAMMESLRDSYEDMLSGAPHRGSPFVAGEQVTRDLFNKFIDSSAMDNLVKGVPTVASGRTPHRRGGINHRLKHPYAASNPSRPSFRDTGLYEQSFRAWVEE